MILLNVSMFILPPLLIGFIYMYYVQHTGGHKKIFSCKDMEYQKNVLQKNMSVNSENRNYEIDFLKLFFSICVFIWHTDPFRDESTKIVFPLQFGGVPVHFFFVVSGMLMANSIIKKNQTMVEPGRAAVLFVINKFRALALNIYAALFVFLLIYIFTIPMNQIPRTLVKILPELFFVTRSGINIVYNGAAWYLSALFICMLPLSFLIYSKRDLTLHILAPLVSVFTLGYFCQINEYCFPANGKMYGFFLGGIYMAVCGLCFGICSYSIYVFFYKRSEGKRKRILLTITEVLLYGIFFGTWFFIRDNQAIMSASLILPIAIALTFSGKSYIGYLFKFKWMKCFAPLSFTIYLNHWIGRVLVQKYYMENSYKLCVFMMAFFTLCSSLLSTLAIRISKLLWKKKLKSAFKGAESNSHNG